MNALSILTSRAAVVLALAVGCSAPVLAQDAYPSKPIRIIVPFPPGGGTDMVARVVGHKLTESWKVPVIVDNRPGGNTLTGAAFAAKAAPDGYTLFLTIDATMTMNPSLYAKLPYDPVRDFAPITLATTNPLVLAVNPQSPIQSVKELVAQAKAKPGDLAYAHGALPAQIAGELFKSTAHVDLLAVAYKGGAPAVADVVGGTVPVLFDALGPSMPHIKAGKLRALAVTSPQRSAALPGVPTLAESGLDNYGLATWIGIFAPAGVSKDRIAKLHSEIARILRLPETRERFAVTGVEVVASTPEEFAQVIKADTVKFDRIIKSAGIRVE